MGGRILMEGMSRIDNVAYAGFCLESGMVKWDVGWVDTLVVLLTYC